MSNIDFIVVGPPHTGTTWLHERMAEHPGLWRPPVKEIHYFDRPRQCPSPSHLASDKRSETIFKGNKPNKKVRHRFAREIFKT